MTTADRRMSVYARSFRVRARAHTHTHARTNTHTHTHTQTYVFCMHTHTHTHTHRNVHDGRLPDGGRGMQGGRRACYPATVRSGRKRAPVCAAACPRVAGSDASSSVNVVLVSCDEVREPWHVTHSLLMRCRLRYHCQ